MSPSKTPTPALGAPILTEETAVDDAPASASTPPIIDRDERIAVLWDWRDKAEERFRGGARTFGKLEMALEKIVETWSEELRAMRKEIDEKLEKLRPAPAAPLTWAQKLTTVIAGLGFTGAVIYGVSRFPDREEVLRGAAERTAMKMDALILKRDLDDARERLRRLEDRKP